MPQSVLEFGFASAPNCFDATLLTLGLHWNDGSGSAQISAEPLCWISCYVVMKQAYLKYAPMCT